MAEKSRVYGNFRGVDFTSDPSQVSPYRFSHCVNMWKDYESQNGIAVETFPGYRRLATASGNMNGIHKFGDKIYCHIGKILYLLEKGEFTQKAGGLADHKSTSFVWGDKLYILDGENYRRYYETGTGANKTSIFESVPQKAYIPTVKNNDADYEQKNILTNKYNESVEISSLKSTFSPNATYENFYFKAESDGKDGVEVYSLTGIEAPSFGILKIPQFVTSDGVTSTVEGIAIAGDIQKHITDIIIPPSIRYMTSDAFYNYVAASGVHLTNLWFEGNQAQWDQLIVHEGAYNAISLLKSSGVVIHINEKPTVDVLYTERNVSNDTIDGKKIGSFVGDDWYVMYQYVEDDPLSAKGSYLFVSNTDVVKTKALLTQMTDGSMDSAFPKCTLVQSFNGNLFFSGSPAAPSKIWWCAAPKDTGIPDPTYIGEYNNDLCGLDDSPIVSMMAQSSVLTVFKKKSDQDATIYYYSALQSEDDLVPSIYAESEGGSGIACVGASCNFLDDAVFLSKRGLEGIQKTAVNLERSVVHRSSFVDAKLQAENLESAWLLEWKGYLCALFPNGHMYLADSRRTASGNEGTEYEWFYVEGLIGYATDSSIYAYADEADLHSLAAALGGSVVDGEYTLGNETYRVKGASIDDIVKGTVKSRGFNVNGKAFNLYYEEGANFICQPLGEYADESGEDITCAAVINDVLYFGAGASLYCINTDERTNKRINEYGEEEECEWHIPNKYYTFCGRRYKSGFVTFADNCGVPHLRKKIIKKSLVVKTKSMDNSKFYLKVGTDRVPFNENEEVHTSGTLDFGALKFDTMDLFDQDKTIVPFRASAKKFVEAQLMLYSDGFKRPFGVYNMAFRFEVTGRVKE